MKNAENTAPTDLEALVRAMDGISVLVAGDIMLDRFVYGGVERISPESPVPVLSVTREEAMPGGAGNTLSNLKELGAKGMILSVTGDDENGKNLRGMIKNLGFDDSGIVTDASRPTIVKTRYLAGHQQLLRTDRETKTPVSDQIAQALLKRRKNF